MSCAVYVEKRGVHDKDSHSAEKDQSKFLKLHQIEAIRSGVIVAPNQSAKHLRRNLMHASPEKRIAPSLARSVERQVRKFRGKLTDAKLEGIAVDDSYGSLVALVDAKWFTTLLGNHNNPDCEYHMDMYEPFIIGKGLNPGRGHRVHEYHIPVFSLQYFSQHFVWIGVSIERRCYLWHQQERCSCAHSRGQFAWACQ